MDLKITQLRQEAKAWRKISPRVSFRLVALVELCKRKQNLGLLKLRELDYELVATKLAVSSRTIIRWKKAYELDGVKGLLPKPIKGRPAFVIRGHLAKRIFEFRKLYTWGAEVIQAHLLYDHQIKLSRYKIERFLRTKGVIKKIRRKKKSSHTRVVKIADPGRFHQN